MEAMLHSFVFNQTFPRFLSVEKHLAQYLGQFKRLHKGLLLLVVIPFVTGISDVESSAVTMGGIRRGIGISATTKVLHVFLGAKDGSHHQSVLQQVLAAQGITKGARYGVKFRSRSAGQIRAGIAKGVDIIQIIIPYLHKLLIINYFRTVLRNFGKPAGLRDAQVGLVHVLKKRGVVRSLLIIYDLFLFLFRSLFLYNIFIYSFFRRLSGNLLDYGLTFNVVIRNGGSSVFSDRNSD